VILALDSSTVLTWLLQERRWQSVQALLNQKDVDFVLPGPALAEVVARARARGNVSSGQQIRDTLLVHGIRAAHPNGDDTLLRAAELIEASAADPYFRPTDSNPHTLSLADAIILAMCEENGWTVVTRDQAWEYSAQQGHTIAKVTTF
jgi:PIN domain nuclease of toxin-antitoxin system